MPKVSFGVEHRVERLFTPLVLPNGTVIPNRIAKAAMEENMADADHAPSEELIRLTSPERFKHPIGLRLQWVWYLNHPGDLEEYLASTTWPRSIIRVIIFLCLARSTPSLETSRRLDDSMRRFFARGIVMDDLKCPNLDALGIRLLEAYRQLWRR